MRSNAGMKTKIVCTIGPASSGVETLKKMVVAGMDVARINSGHCDIDDVARLTEVVKEAGEQVGERVGVMLDLQGPRLRVGPIRGTGVQLEKGREFVITTEQTRGDDRHVSVQYEGLTGDLKPGDQVLIDDGLIRLGVRRIEGPEVVCEVLEGGPLSQGKGMNFPGVRLGLPAFTERDRRYLEAGLRAGVDWISQSFIRDAADVQAVKDAARELGSDIPVMAKIEKGEAMLSIDSILEVSDGVMVARGDLGVEMNAEDVPIVQKEIIAKAQVAATPVVTATQMLESMVHNARPTRAEASDVANAILDGTDAVMLSAETAVGSYPTKVVETMAKIAEKAESAVDYGHILEERGKWKHRDSADAIAYSACKVASDLGAKAVVAITRSGYTARLIARNRPRAMIVAASSDEAVVEAMTMLWGVAGVVVPPAETLRETFTNALVECRRCGLLAGGDLVVIIGGFLTEKSGTTNMLTIHTVE